MRIGEINQNNYKQFLALFGVKGNKTLDNLMGADGKASSKQAVQISPNFEEGMDTSGTSGDEWHKIVPVSDEVRDKIVATVRRQFLENGNGMVSSKNGMEIGAIMKEYRKNIPPSERLAVTWTLSQIQINEERRLVNYVKSQNPSWSFGTKIDKSILTSTDFGTKSVDIKA
jgi:hypothetical protein